MNWRFWEKEEPIDHSEAERARERAKDAHRTANGRWLEVVDLTSNLRRLREDNHLGERLGLAFRRSGK
jgi:hypothetical protein